MNTTPSITTRTCLRCSVPMDFLGKQGFSDSVRWAANVETAHQAYTIYACPQCRKLEFFLLEPATVQREGKRPFIPTPSIELATLAITPDPIKLLKLKPGKSTLADVYEAIGHPMQFHPLERTIALCYPSDTDGVPQTVLINRLSQRVELVTIYNEAEIFTLEALEAAYGLRELADTIDGNEHWFFEGGGVAFVVEGRNDSDIMYLQLLNPSLTLTEYQDANGYSPETFIC